MPFHFDDAALAGVLGHMNADHPDDNLLIVRAYGRESAVAGIMVSFDGDGGDWTAEDADGTSTAVHVPWPGGPITERRDVRREIVALYEESCRLLGIEPRPH